MGQNKKRVFINLRPLIEDKQSIIKMVLSLRNDGKTTGMKCAALESFYESGKAAVFCRRWRDSELSGEFYDTFLENVYTARKSLLDGREPRIEGTQKKGRYLTVETESGRKKAISFESISMAGRHKSNYDWNTHRNIFIDEYIPLDGRYVKDEMTQILELYKTVDREHYDNYVMIAGNRITRFNPVFQYFGVKQWHEGVNTYQNGRLRVLMYANAGNKELAKQSPFAELTAGTNYEQYNAGEFLQSMDQLICPSHGRLRLFDIAHNGKTFSAFQAGINVVIDFAPRSDSLTCVCITPQAAALSAVWLDAAKGVKSVLEKYKYTNRLYFASDAILYELTDFYKSI